MLRLDEPSRACATVATRVPPPVLNQNVVTLSVTGTSSALTKYAYCVSSVAIRAPKVPACAARPTTEVEPVPWVGGVQFERSPVSKPSEKTTFVYCARAGTGVTGADGVEAGPVPMLLIAATVNVYAVPFVRPVTT